MNRPKYDFVSAHMGVEHTCGNVAAYVVDTIKTWFEPKFFKTVNVSTKMAYRYFNVLQNTDAKFFKNRKPFLIVQPRINVGGEQFLKGTMLTERIFPTNAVGDYGNLQHFLDDREKGYTMKYMMNRINMSFDITMIFETPVEQMQRYFFLKNRVIFDRPLTWETNLECHIPREMIAAVSSLVDIPLAEPSQMLHYLNTHSKYPVTYKMKNSSGNDEYFRYYPANLDVILSDLNMDGGTKAGLVDDTYPITFTVNVEFFSTGLYHIISSTPIPKFWNNGGMAVTTERSEQLEDMRMSMLLTPYRDLGLCIPAGWRVLHNFAYQVTAKAPEVDTTDISKVLHPSLKNAIAYHLNMKIPVDKLLQIFVMQDYETLDQSKGEYAVDLERLSVYTYKLNKLSTYRVIVMVNLPYMHELSIQLSGMKDK